MDYLFYCLILVIYINHNFLHLKLEKYLILFYFLIYYSLMFWIIPWAGKIVIRCTHTHHSILLWNASRCSGAFNLSNRTECLSNSEDFFCVPQHRKHFGISIQARFCAVFERTCLVCCICQLTLLEVYNNMWHSHKPPPRVLHVPYFLYVKSRHTSTAFFVK